MFEGEVLVVRSFGVSREDGSPVVIGGEFDNRVSHRRAITYRGIEAAVCVTNDFGHSAYIRYQRGKARGHGLKKGHGQAFGDRRHGEDIGRGEEVGNIEALSPECHLFSNS